jgi:hypothetical protein
VKYTLNCITYDQQMHFDLSLREMKD